MTQYKEDHFYNQFDKYPEGTSRFEAVARHAAFLLNMIEEKQEEEKETLLKIRRMLEEGVNPVRIALSIQERLQSSFEETDLPSL